jgi:hydrogenase maturation protease
VDLSITQLGDDLRKIAVTIKNTSGFDGDADNRNAVQMYSMLSAHSILSVENGQFLSLLEPPENAAALAAECKNTNTWPVLVGEPGSSDVMLSSPIILYDYPQIAPESPGDLFDGTEIDEILSLRIMTMTDEEKKEVREADPRGRALLDRTDALPPEQLMKLHGVLRGLRPSEQKAS